MYSPSSFLRTRRQIQKAVNQIDGVSSELDDHLNIIRITTNTEYYN
jgi:hypothetical protein